jgi:hypothetical protein
MASNNPPLDLEGEYVLRSGVRAGLKREFAFAMRAQSELHSIFGRTRSSQSVKKPKVSEIPLSSWSQPLDRHPVPPSLVEVNVPSSKDSLDEQGMKSGVEIENKENLAECGAKMGSSVGVFHPVSSQNSEAHACTTFNGRLETADGSVAGPQNEAPIYIYTRRKSLKTAGLGKEREVAKMEAVSNRIEEQLPLESPISISSTTLVIRFTRSALVQTPEENGSEGTASEMVNNMAQKEQVLGRRLTRSLLKEQVDGARSKPVAGESSTNGVPSRKNNMGIKMSKKISVKKVPSTVKDLLSTGLLEGLAVEYKFPSGRVCQSCFNMAV